MWVSLVEIGQVVLPNSCSQTHRHTDTQTDRQTDRQTTPVSPDPNDQGLQYIQSMKMTECKKRKDNDRHPNVLPDFIDCLVSTFLQTFLLWNDSSIILQAIVVLT